MSNKRELPNFDGAGMLGDMEKGRQKRFKEDKKTVGEHAKQREKMHEEIVSKLRNGENNPEKDELGRKFEALQDSIRVLKIMKERGDLEYEKAKQNVIKGIEDFCQSLGMEEKPDFANEEEALATIKEIEDFFQKKN